MNVFLVIIAALAHFSFGNAPSFESMIYNKPGFLHRSHMLPGYSHAPFMGGNRVGYSPSPFLGGSPSPFLGGYNDYGHNVEPMFHQWLLIKFLQQLKTDTSKELRDSLPSIATLSNYNEVSLRPLLRRYTAKASWVTNALHSEHV